MEDPTPRPAAESGPEAEAPLLDPVPLQDRDGLLFRRRHEIALARDEAFGRVEVTLATGEVFFRPGPLSALEGWPFVAGDGFLFNPRHARRRGAELRFPGGWRIPWEGPVPRPAPAPKSPMVERLGVRQDEVIYLHAQRNKARWVVDSGEIPEKLSALQARRFHPGLVQAGYHYVNPLRLRAIRSEGPRFRLFLDRGIELTVYHNAREPLQTGLALPQLYALEPWTPEAEVLLREGLRDWPCELFRAPERFLKENFAGNFRLLVANVLWQTVRSYEAGVDLDYNTDHRGYWYRPLLTILSRAGLFRDPSVPAAWQEGLPEDRLMQLILALLTLDPGQSLVPLGSLDRYREFQVLVARLVGDDRIFGYRGLRFEEPRPDLREIGQTRPGVVVLAEKATTRKLVRALARAFGSSYLILGGQASLLVTEFFVAALRERWQGPVRVVAYVDYDPWGWIIARAFCKQLERYGVEVEGLHFLVRPERFTDQELRTLPVALPSTTKVVRQTVSNWMKETGGVRGRRLGVHADHLRPLSRLVQAMREETGLEVLQGPRA